MVNQASSFCSALNRWEILFFSASSISAYLQSVNFLFPPPPEGGTCVFPSYSKMGSQPGYVRSASPESFKKREETHQTWAGPWPARSCPGPSRQPRHLAPPFAPSRPEDATHLGDALEQDRLLSGARYVGKGAHGPGRLVLVGGQELVQAVEPEPVEEPLAVGASAPLSGISPLRSRRVDAHVRPR